MDANLYQSACNIPDNRRLALTIVIIAAVSRSLGSAVTLLINRTALPLLVLELLVGGISVVVGYYFWTFTIWKLGQWLRSNRLRYKDLQKPDWFCLCTSSTELITFKAAAVFSALWSVPTWNTRIEPGKKNLEAYQTVNLESSVGLNVSTGSMEASANRGS